MAERAWQAGTMETGLVRRYTWGTVDLTEDHESPSINVPDFFMFGMHMQRVSSFSGGTGSPGLYIYGYPDPENLPAHQQRWGWAGRAGISDPYIYTDGSSTAYAAQTITNNAWSGEVWKIALPGGRIQVEHVAAGATTGIARISFFLIDLTHTLRR